MLDRIEVVASGTVDQILIVKPIFEMVLWTWRYLMPATGIAFAAKGEFACAEDVLSRAQQVALAAYVSQTKAHAASGVLGGISAILR